MVDPASREMAEDMARRAGMSLNEWLARLMADGPEDATSQDYFAQPGPGYLDQPATAPGASAEEVRRVIDALERLSDRIESAENRQALAVAGIERSVREVIARIDAGEREQMQVAARFEGVTQEVQSEQARAAERLTRLELENEGPRSMEAVRALEGAVGKVATQVFEGERRTREAFGQLSARIERIDQTERATHGAIRELKGACSELDGRIGRIEAATPNIETIAESLSARVDAVRQELAEQLASAADVRFDRIEQALARMGEHVRIAEQRSASALEKMGHEVLEVAQNLNRRVQAVEHGSAESAERIGAQVQRMASQVEDRLARTDAIQAQALEKLGSEIARITERLAERIASAERRSAQAIDDVGEQVARVTERIGQRHERATGELAERIRQSEERTARLLEEARQRIDERLAETQRRITEAQAAAAAPPAPPAEDPDDALFADAPFPVYQPPTPPAERPFSRPAAMYTPILGKPLTAPPRFDDADFEAAAEAEAPEPEPDPPIFAEAPEPASAVADAPELQSMFAEAPTPVADETTPEPPSAVTLTDEAFEAVQLEPNVGFDLDDDPPPEAAAEPQAPIAAAAPLEAAADEIDIEAFEPAPAEALADEFDIPAEPEPEPRTTRDVVERARRAAQAEAAGRSRLRPAARNGESVVEGLAFGRARKPGGGGMTGALMVASLLAAVSLSAGGFLFLEGKPQGKLPKNVSDALALGGASSAPGDHAPQPMAAMALAPTPIAQASPESAGLYATAVASIESGQNAGVAQIRKLAEQGYAPAEFYLSKLYDDGRGGVKRDPVEARRWLQRAADSGDRTAMHNLAMDFWDGSGGPRDKAQAAEWFRRAAELGFLDSQYNLAGLYEHGEGVALNPAEAYKWYLIAARAGDKESKAGATRVGALLTPQARAIAERAAQAFQPNSAPPAAAGTTTVVTSPDMMTAQRALMQLGYYQGPTDGVPSQALHLALAAYQRDQSLPVTGSPDQATIDRLAAYVR